MTSARRNHSQESSIDTSRVYAQGGFKLVYLGTYTRGERQGQSCVCKVFKSGLVFEARYLRWSAWAKSPLCPEFWTNASSGPISGRMSVIDKAMHLLDKFNNEGIIDKKIYLNAPEIWTFLPNVSQKWAGVKCLVEPMIENFEKFNSNTGW